MEDILRSTIINAYSSKENLDLFLQLGISEQIVPLCIQATELRKLKEPFSRLMQNKQYYDTPNFIRYSFDVTSGNKHYLVFPLSILKRDISILKKHGIAFDIKSLGYNTTEATKLIEENVYFGSSKLTKIKKKIHLMNKVVYGDDFLFMKYKWEK